MFGGSKHVIPLSRISTAKSISLLKLTVPGIPDIYNGDELPLLSLVDPDNRRPVDWDERRDRLRPEWRDARPGDWSIANSFEDPASLKIPR